jgi:methylthioribose-1-phosphate isomerase
VTSPPALTWRDEPPALLVLDQTRLPDAEVVLECGDVDSVVDAIRRLAVRGAPLLGIAGAYAVALAALTGADVAAAADLLAAARPTAVNLGVGVARARAAYDAGGAVAALAAARAVEQEDRAAAEAMARHGLTLVPEGARVLTHCNTGRLVSAGGGTAFGVIEAAHRAGRLAQLWIDETRPLLQGGRLTAWEARAAGIPHAVLVDAAAGSLFARGLVDLVIVGADRIAADGSVANKVGTYPLAVLADRHGVPFVVVAPTSTVDPATPDGDAIVVEQRDPAEVSKVSPAYNPAFDVTPPALVTAVVTERGVVAAKDAASLVRPALHSPEEMRRLAP